MTNLRSSLARCRRPVIKIGSAVLAGGGGKASLDRRKFSALCDDIAAAAKGRTPVVRVKTVSGRATGVVLESGEEVDAGVVMSSLDSRWTFIRLLDEGVLDPVFREEVLRYKYRGSSGKVNLALDGLPNSFHGDPADWLIVATARAHALRLATRDTAIRRSRLVKLWKA